MRGDGQRARRFSLRGGQVLELTAGVARPRPCPGSHPARADAHGTMSALHQQAD